MVAEFDAECEAAHRAHGFHGPAGYCPALIAENDACKAEAAVLESLGTAFEFNGNGGNAKTRESLLALAVQMTA